MNSLAIKNLFTIAIAVCLTLSVSIVVPSGNINSYSIPVIVSCAILSFIIQWIAFIPAFLLKTEKFYDLVGSLTYISLLTVAALYVEQLNDRSLLLVLLIGIWALRLGMFLFLRIKQDGYDRRLIRFKSNATRFLLAWTIQGSWVFITIIAAITAITSNNNPHIDLFAWAGLTIWLAGFLMETIADNQKRRFRENLENADKFIKSGLWSWSRHPNYFGEILIWIGIAIISLPALTGWQFLALISPIFVYVLLTKISGIPMLEESAQERWGGDSDYISYVNRTSILVPKKPGQIKTH